MATRSGPIGEILPGGGYFTRLFSKAVGPEGHVYAIINPRNPERPTPAAVTIAADPAYANVSVVEELVNMITTQRAYEMNSKVISTADEMLSVTAQVKG